MKGVRVAVLGAGIMGSCTALLLARGGARVTLFDAAERPFEGASRWSEGKIHLGYLYAAEPALLTARRVLPGGLAFKTIVEELIGEPLDPAIAEQDDIHLVHRESVVSAEATERYFNAVAALVAENPEARRYLVDASHSPPRKLSSAELGEFDTHAIVAGYELRERSVNTRWVADRFVAALEAEPKIELVMQTRVSGVRPVEGTINEPLNVDTSAGATGPFDFVVNALWEGRLEMNSALDLLPKTPWLHRYRLSLFLRTSTPVAMHGAIAVTGPFGDVKNYDNREFYLSWYPAGLLAEGSGVKPPAIPERDPARIENAIFSGLSTVFPSILKLRRHAEKIDLRGGWIYSLGEGRLDDAGSALHRRDRIGITRRGSYFSVDTGKYSMSPWLAKQLAAQILER